jgi:hypothetical protein
MLVGSFMTEWMGITQKAGADPMGFQSYFQSGNFWIQLSLMFVFIMISGVVTLATINNYILLYGEKKTNKIEVSEVWERVRDTFWMYFGTMFFFAFIAIIVYVVLIIPIVILGAISPALIFFGVLIFIVGFCYLLFAASLTFIIRTYEKIGFFPAIIRSFKLVQGKWWSTFGLILILYLIMMVISYIPMIPFYTMLFVNSLHNVNPDQFASPSTSWEIWTTVFFTVYYMLQMFLNTLPNVGIAFQYFNLVELKEAKGLMSEIQTLGKPSEADRPQEHF